MHVIVAKIHVCFVRIEFTVAECIVIGVIIIRFVGFFYLSLRIFDNI